MQDILVVSSLNLVLEILWVFAWNHDFVSTMVKITEAQCWAKLKSLLYWKLHIVLYYWRDKHHLSLDECCFQDLRGSLQGFWWI